MPQLPAVPPPPLLRSASVPAVPPLPMLTATPTRHPRYRARPTRRPGNGRIPTLALVAAAAVLLGGGGATLNAVTRNGSTTPPTVPPPGNVNQWISQATAVLEANGTPASAINASDLWIIIKNESGGNPNSINTWDSNARAGNPSEGLMQITGTTFRANAVPGHGNIWDPVDNIVAGTRYAINRYGSLDNVPGVRSIHNGGGYLPY